MLMLQLRRYLTLFALLIAATSSAHAKNDQKLQPTRLDRAAVEAWADKYYGQAVADKRNAAIGISVLQDGKLLFQKTYGYRDYARKIPANPETTGFMVGSITKTFVATAVAQLVDRGVIKSLDDPVNKYLTRFKLPGTYGAQVTIAQVLNHRAGFEDVDFGFVSGGKRKLALPLPREEILRFLPDIVKKPGGAANYSNWGFSLLGFMVEDITKQRLDTYLKRNIFDPLGMKQTVLWYDKAPTHIAMQYQFTADGRPLLITGSPPHPWIAPAGTLVSTPADMALYMNAHILEGRDGGFPLLSSKMYRTLHRETYRNSPVSTGFAHAFWTDKIDGAGSIEHGGGTPGFQSMMTMIPDRKIGFFVSAVQSGLADGQDSSAGPKGKQQVHDPLTGFELRQSFLETFFPPSAPFPDGPKFELKHLMGTYLSQARVYNSVEKLGAAFNPSKQLEISLSKDGGGLLFNGFGPYQQIGNGVFKNASGISKWVSPYKINPFYADYIAFKMNLDGTPAYLVGGVGDQVWEPVSSIYNPQSMLRMFMVFGGVLMTGALIFIWPIGKRARNPQNWISLGLTLSVTAIVYAVLGGFATGDSLPNQMAMGNAGRLWMIAVASNFIMTLGALMLFVLWRDWNRKSEQPIQWGAKAHRVHSFALLLAAALLIPVFMMFNLIGFHIPG